MRERFAAFAWSVLGLNILVVIWGAFVRASKSGAGCGESWPLCNGELLPKAPALPTIIEFTHRVTSGLALLVLIALVVWAFRLFPKGHIVRRVSAWSAAFMVVECLIGAALVLLGHVAENPALARGYTLSVHLVNTMFLLGSLALTAWWAGRDEGALGPARPVQKPLFGVAVALLLVAMVVGAIAALGDTLYTATTHAEGLRANFAQDSHPFVRMRILHPILAAAAGVCLFGLGLRAALATTETFLVRVLGAAVAGLTIVQILLGALNIVLLVPIYMQLIHLFFADLVWLALVLFAAESMWPQAARVPAGMKIAWGVMLCLTGITGIIMPIMPGWIFLIPGLLILSEYVPALKRLVEWLREKMPKHIAWQKRPEAWEVPPEPHDPAARP
ncbi:MAG: COX15/CtaA family protein [Bryobacteraceae bacterium]|nr:COX15/CtaA family protein [Bryobacteraceae bacterium]